MRIRKFTSQCYIDNTSFERTKNNIWISQTNNTELIIHNSRCPLDYCKTKSVNVTLSDPSLQCDFNRDGTLCWQCQKNFSLTFGSLHCIPCDDSHATLIVIFSLVGVILISFSPDNFSWKNKRPPFLCQHCSNKWGLFSKSKS